tara:strand:+ start:13770 stop:15209 length:1440 start_codon:yes stop_codon:yes gene_type:complete
MVIPKKCNDLITHLLRRAGFGATISEMEQYSRLEYKEIVDRLLDFRDSSYIADDVIYRDHVDLHSSRSGLPAYWGYRILSTNNPLEEKMALFWHGVFATGNSKLNNLRSLLNQIDMFREYSLSKFDDILLELSKDPAMLIWLDNQDNHKDAINENYGREILELFSMGVGNYSEDDIKECSRAFTGWTITNPEYMSLMSQKDSIWPYGRIVWHYNFDDVDHDSGEKVFLGESGNFNGEDVVKIICNQQATANFVARHLYNFFVADEVPVPQWGVTPPKDPEAIDELAKAYFTYDHNIGSMIKVLFNSDFFKKSIGEKVKSPTELVFGTLRLSGEYNDQSKIGSGIYGALAEAGFMGQELTNPPSVEGWHTGEEWITSGALVDRVNFASSHLSDAKNEGVKEIIDKTITEVGERCTIEQLANSCSYALGILELSNETSAGITELLESESVEIDRDGLIDIDENTIISTLKLIVSSREYQIC